MWDLLAFQHAHQDFFIPLKFELLSLKISSPFETEKTFNYWGKINIRFDLDFSTEYL